MADGLTQAQIDEPNFLERLMNGAVDVALGIGNALIPVPQAAPQPEKNPSGEEGTGSALSVNGINLTPLLIGGGLFVVALLVINFAGKK